MSDLILKLALQAMHDADALPVLGDAIVEARWYDPRLAPLILGPYGVSPYFEDWSTGTTKWWIESIRSIGDEGARAVAAVLLFADWPTSWPLAMRTIVAMPFAFLTNEEMSEGDILVHSGGVWSYLRNAPIIVQPTPDEVDRHQHDPLTLVLQSPKESDKP